MIKRPLLWALIGFVLGEVLTFFSDIVIVFFIVLCLSSIIIFIITLKRYERFYEYDNILLLMPIIMYIGFVLMNNQQSIPLYDDFINEKATVSVEGTIYKLDEKSDRYTVYIKNCMIIYDDSVEMKKYQCNKIIVYITKDTILKTGNVVNFQGKLFKFQKPRNLGQFDEFNYYKMQGIDYKLNASNVQITNNHYNKLNHILMTIKYKLQATYDVLLNDKDSGIINAMVLGDKSELNMDIKDLYQQNGISHILAISGLHISLIGMALFGLLRLLGLNMSISCGVSIILIFCYGELTGFSVSTNRAVVMLIITLIAKIIGRTYDMLSAISLSALIILVFQPMQIFNAGFLLSFGAVLGIATLTPIFTELIPNKNTIVDGFIVSISVNIMTLPVILYFFYEFPLYSLVINLLIIPLMSLLMPLALVSGILGCFSILLGTFSIGGVHYILVVYELVCNAFMKLPYNNVLIGRPEIWQIVLYYLVIIIFVLLTKVIHKKSLFTLILMCVLLIRLPNKGLELTFIDVGQGDGIFFETKSGTTYLVDGGSSQINQVGKYRIIPFLKGNRVGKLDYIIITHLHEDHISGIREIINEMDIGVLLLPVANLSNETYLELVELAKEKDIDVKHIKKGDMISDGDVKIQCLHPYEGFVGKGENEYSTVLSVELGNFKALLTGDLEASQEKLIEPLLSNYFLLKVGHHGSKTSTGEDFLDIVKPYVSIISSGKNNVYKHPNEEVIERLKNYGTMIIDTQDNGAVMLKTDGYVIDIRTYFSKRRIRGGY